jgi:hypothetical protein
MANVEMTFKLNNFHGLACTGQPREITLTEDEARELYEKLFEFFGGKQAIYLPSDVYDRKPFEPPVVPYIEPISICNCNNKIGE